MLRRIIRRAIRHGYKLGQKRPFFHKLVEDLDRQMGDAYPELRRDKLRVAQILKAEEERFGETLENGMKLLEQALADGRRTLDGDTAFTLYDTFGFPLDLTADVCRERDIAVDEAGFEKAMTAQRERARAASQFKMGEKLDYEGVKTAFHGYDTLSHEGRVTALYQDGTPVASLTAGERGVVVLDHTPFYAESGGQVGDRGELSKSGVCLTLFAVDDTQKVQPDVFGHLGEVKTGELKVGDTVAAEVDHAARGRTVRNHSATHLMHKALREVLGTHVQQKGSLVDPDKTRFDFAHHAPMTDDEIRRVEAIVNREIVGNAATQARVMPIDEAQKVGAMMLFGEKYGDEVRVLDIGSSRELCGGTHVTRTGDIGFFKIVGEGGVAAGIRRVEAVTGDNALAWVQAQEAQLAARRRRAEGARRRDRGAHRAADRAGEGGREGSREAQGQARRRLARRRAGRGAVQHRRRQARRRAHRRRRRRHAARRARQGEGARRQRRRAARLGRRRQGGAGGRRDQGPRRPLQGGRRRQRRGEGGRRQGRRPARHGAGGRHRPDAAARGADGRARVRRGAGQGGPRVNGRRIR